MLKSEICKPRPSYAFADPASMTRQPWIIMIEPVWQLVHPLLHLKFALDLYTATGVLKNNAQGLFANLGG